MRLRAAIARVVGQETFHPRKAAPEKPEGGAGAQMRERIVDENINRPGDDVIRRRTELAFFANDLPLPKTMENGRALRPILKLGARNFFERRQILDELIDAQRFARR